VIFQLLLAVPEKIWDEHQNTEKYQYKLNESNRRYQSNKDATDVETQKTWFSQRMWAYRNLVYWVHVKKSPIPQSQLGQ
jgi:hypothetical protein